MSSIFSGIVREDRVLLVDDTQLPKMLASEQGKLRWQVDGVGSGLPQRRPMPSNDEDAPACNAFFERVKYQWHEKWRQRPLVITKVVLQRLLPVRSSCKRVTSLLPPLTREQLKERQRQQLITQSLCRSYTAADGNSTTGDDEEDASAHKFRRWQMESFERSEVAIRLAVIWGNPQHCALPFSLTVDLGSRVSCELASRFGATTPNFRTFASLVWLILEGVAQLCCFTSVADLISATTAQLETFGLHLGIESSSRKPPRLVNEAFEALRNAWHIFRASTASASAPCGIAAVLLGPGRRFLANESEVFVPTAPGGTMAVIHDQLAAINEARNTTLRDGICRLIHLVRSGGLTSLVRPVSLPFHSALTEADAATLVPLGPPPALQLLISDLNQLMIQLRGVTGRQMLDALCFVAAPLFVGIGASSSAQVALPATAVRQVELTRQQRLIFEAWVSLQLPSNIERLRGGPQMVHWYVDAVVPSSSSNGGGGVGNGGGIALRLLARLVDETSVVIATSLDFLAADASTDDAKRTTAPGSVVEDDLARVERRFSSLNLASFTSTDIAAYLVAMSDCGVRLSQKSENSVSGAERPLLVRLRSTLLIPIQHSHSAFMRVLQSHPEGRYIAGCGVRCFYVTGDGKLQAERVCYRFCEWDYKQSFAVVEDNRGAVSMGPLLQPRGIIQARQRHKLPHGVEYWRTTYPSIIDMLRYYRTCLEEATSRGEAPPQGRMFLATEDVPVLQHVFSHHPHYLGRRGCGVESFYVTINSRMLSSQHTVDRSSSIHVAPAAMGDAAVEASAGADAAAAQDEDDFRNGYCTALLLCGRSVRFHVSECFETDNLLKIPMVLEQRRSPIQSVSMRGYSFR